ncbi:hypothetical protein [Lutimonas sp.]|uniref:hypothetical protein n=1 Tax=Lutimonas sp. TaxID=1872403 RepID=UPI003D9AFFEC
MHNNLMEELRTLAESILQEPQGPELETRLEQARNLYEKLLILDHLNKNERQEAIPEQENTVQEILEVQEEVEVVEIKETVQETLIAVAIEEEAEEIVESLETEEDVPMSLNDLFVPTFDEIKEDMSQKEEFKDTISLDETENLFQTKKEVPRQLSLNDRLVGSSIQVGLNDRIAFVNKLFNFSQSDFNKVLTKLNECNSKEEAIKYFEYQVKPNYNWKGKEDLEERLIILIERKFL